MNETQLREAMEACRPGRDDLALAELEELAARLQLDPDMRRQFDAIQRMDAELCEAFQDVPVPAGLSDRLLASVADTPLPTEIPETESPELGRADEFAESADPAEPVEPAARQSLGRRAAIAAFFAATAACLALVVSQLWDERPVALEELESVTQEWVEAALVWPDDSWQTVSLPPTSHRIDSRVRVAATGWHKLPTQYDSEGIVYNLPARGSGRAMLVVLQTRRYFDLPAVPHQTIRLSGDWSAGAWKTNEHLYVLAVRNAKVSDYLRQAQIAAAFRPGAVGESEVAHLLAAR